MCIPSYMSEHSHDGAESRRGSNSVPVVVGAQPNLQLGLELPPHSCTCSSFAADRHTDRQTHECREIF